MPIFTSLDRLNAMHDLFTTQGNNKLDAGETDALAAFYRGLPPSSAKKIEARLVDIYKTSGFAAGQKKAFEALLRGAGIPGHKLVGQGPAPTVAELRDWAGSGYTKKIKEQDLPSTTRVKLRAEIDQYIGSSQDAYEGDLKAILNPDTDAVVGYTCTVTDPDDADPSGWELSVLTFDLKGKLVDSDSTHT